MPSDGRDVGRHPRDALAFELDLAQVRLKCAGDDVHQGRLAGAVLAEDGVNLTRMELDADIRQRHHAGEELGDFGQP